MADNSDNSGKKPNSKTSLGGAIAIIIVIIVIAVGIGSCGGSCSGSDDKYRQTFKDGYEKYLNNEKMTREEHDAVSGYLNWKNNQGEKKYDEWK